MHSTERFVQTKERHGDKIKILQSCCETKAGTYLGVRAGKVPPMPALAPRTEIAPSVAGVRLSA